MSLKIEIDISKYIEKIKCLSLDYLRKFNITHLLLIFFALHLFTMCFPSDGGMIFDEVHYIKATRAHLEGIGANAEHTPLVKVGMSVVFSVLGDYWFAWRMPIVMCCMMAYVSFYYIAKHFLEEKYALIATTFLCLDTMFFIHGTIFLLDMPAIMFGLGAFALFLKKQYKISAVSMALAILCKEIALLFLGVIAIYWIGQNIRGISFKKLKVPLTYLLIVALIGFSFMTVYDNVYKISSKTVVSTNVKHTIVNDEFGNAITTNIVTEISTYSKYINNPLDHLKMYMTYHTEWMVDLNNTYRAYNKPWNWIAPFDIEGIFDHPIYFQVSVTAGAKQYNSMSYRGQGTLPIWYSVWLVVPMAIYSLVKGKEKKLSLFLLGWITSTFGGFVVLELLRNSTGFNYYFIYTVPALCLGIPYFWKQLNLSKNKTAIGLSIHLVATLCFFIYYFPIGLFR